jgi:hypothetical protein
MDNKLLDEFAMACIHKNLEEIRRLAPFFDLNNTIFKKYWDRPTPLILAMDWNGELSGFELLISLGARVSPYDAYHIYFAIYYDSHVAEEIYLNFFLSKGYDIKSLSRQCERPFYHSSDEEYTDSDEEDIEKLT